MQKWEENTLQSIYTFSHFSKGAWGHHLNIGTFSHISNTVSLIEMCSRMKYKIDGKQVLQLPLHCTGQHYNINSNLQNISIIITTSSEVWQMTLA